MDAHDRAVTEQPEHRWAAVVVAAVVICRFLPSTFIPVPRYILPIIATRLAIPLIVPASFSAGRPPGRAGCRSA
jgi:hypothetical protein